MKRPREVRLISASHSAHQILETALEFSKEVAGWEPHEMGLVEESVTAAHCMIISTASPAAGVAVYAEHLNKHAVHVTNIVPRDKSELTLSEYNLKACVFVDAFRKFLRSKRIGIKIQLTEEERGLDAAIPGKQCRKWFTRYLHGYPLSYHPDDIENLDLFICALHRYSRKSDPDAIAQYLVSDLRWKLSDATFVQERIRTGLDILRANKRF
jgi:hypothetical protein